MGNVVLVGCLDEGIDAVVDVFLNAIVDAALAVAAAGAVVIDTKAAPTIDELDVEAHRMELHIVLCRFTKGGADAAYLVDLAADVEMDEAQAVAQPQLVEFLQRHQELRRVQSELRGVTTTLAPLAAAVACQLDADAQVGVHTKLLCCFGNDCQFW